MNSRVSDQYLYTIPGLCLFQSMCIIVIYWYGTTKRELYDVVNHDIRITKLIYDDMLCNNYHPIGEWNFMYVFLFLFCVIQMFLLFIFLFLFLFYPFEGWENGAV